MSHSDFVDSIWNFKIFSQRLTQISLTLFGLLGVLGN